ncbi:MAG: DUF4468 domain-containing protein [Paludibacter sp.]|jgi:hypothetical protein|nr:DUF4468 domain-containing protein [Paludibacter sp.]
MRTFISIALMFLVVSIPLSGFAQTDTICGVIPFKGGKVCYENVVPAKDLTADVLYNNAKVWIANNFGSAKAVIQTDVPNSSLVMKGVIQEDAYVKYDFTLTLQFRDARYKYTLTDLVYNFSTIKTPVEEQPFMNTCPVKTVLEFDVFFKTFLKRVESGIITDNNW